MKKTITILAIAFSANFASAQNCSVWIDNYMDASCPGACNGTADAMAAVLSGDYPKSWVWMPGNLTGYSVQGLCAGTTYTLTMTTNKGCTDVTTITIGPSNFSCSITKTDPTCGTCPNGSATANVSGGTPGYNYSWSPGGQATQTATGLTAGNYTVYVSDANGCNMNPQTVTLGTTTSIGAASITNLEIYPNPATAQLTVSFGNSNAAASGFSILNILGEEVHSEPVTAGMFSSTVNTSAYPAGIYFVSIRTASGSTVHKFVKL